MKHPITKAFLLWFPCVLLGTACGMGIPLVDQDLALHELTIKDDCATIDVELDDETILGLHACEDGRLEVCCGEGAERVCIPMALED
jgi:hypothetical protein